MAVIWNPQDYLNAGICDTEIPNGTAGNGFPFLFSDDAAYAGGGNRWFFRCADGISGRSQYMQTQTVQNPSPPSSQSFFVVGRTLTTTTVLTGEIWYVAMFFRIKRINGLDVHLRSPGVAFSFDKSGEVGGATQSMRWLFATGTWGDLPQPVPAGQYTSHPQNPSHHLNPAEETGYGDQYYYDNVAPYSSTNPYYLTYDRWYAHVLEFKVSTTATGHMKYYINGTKTCDYTNIKTWNTTPTPMQFDGVRIGGTLGQSAYNTPPHLRGIDGWVVTDDLAFLQAGGWFSDPEVVSPTIVRGRRVLIQ